MDPASSIREVAASIVLTGSPVEQVAVAFDAIEAARDLAERVASLRAAVVRDLVAAVGATAAAKELGVTRVRVYQMMNHKE